MAEALARHTYADGYQFYSAGIETHGLNPHAMKVLEEIGVDISMLKSKTLEEVPHEVDVVFTVCSHADETCPAFPGKKFHVGFDDPPKLAQGLSGEDELEVYRKVRDEISDFIESLPNYLKS